MKRLALVGGILLGLWLVAPPLSAQLNRIAAAQINCLANTLVAGSSTGRSTCSTGPTISGTLTAGGIAASGAIQSTGSGLSAASGATIGFNSVAKLFSNTDKQLLVRDSGGTTGLELNVGVPTLGTCTAGVLTSGSHNFAGEIASNTSSSCVLNFGTPNFTNTPFCSAASEASTTHPRISAASASSITITGGVSGETITYHCDGRIGT